MVIALAGLRVEPGPGEPAECLLSQALKGTWMRNREQLVYA